MDQQECILIHCIGTQDTIIGTASTSFWQMDFVDTVWNRYECMIGVASIEACIRSAAKQVEDGS